LTVITIVKTLPASSFYTGSGATTITLNGANNLTLNSKKSLIKIQKPKTKSNQISSPSDVPDNTVIDLKKCDENIKISGYLEDDASETAWNKLWKLRAMVSTGGPLTSLTIGTAVPLAFGTTVQDVFLESVTGIIEADDTGDITASFTPKPARIRLELNFYIGNER
jgi:hypothetical protein